MQCSQLHTTVGLLCTDFSVDTQMWDLCIMWHTHIRFLSAMLIGSNNTSGNSVHALIGLKVISFLSYLLGRLSCCWTKYDMRQLVPLLMLVAALFSYCGSIVFIVAPCIHIKFHPLCRPSVTQPFPAAGMKKDWWLWCWRRSRRRWWQHSSK